MDDNLSYEDIFHGLIKGKQYVLKSALRSDYIMFQEGTLRFYVPGGFDEIHMTDDGKYFAWTHAGSSANDATMDGLRFIIDTIFSCKPSDFTELNHHAILDVINEGR